MASKKLNLTRDQLATFLKSAEQIKQFERLFAVVDEVAPASDTPGIEQQTLMALATSNQAIELVQELKQCLQVMITTQSDRQMFEIVEALTNEVQGLKISMPPTREFERSSYGSFYDTTTQTAAVVNTGQAVTFNTTDLSQGVYIDSGSQITVDTPGVYNFQLSIQLDKTSGGTGAFYIWFAKNGTAVTNSASKIVVQGNNAEVFSALNFFFDLAAGDYVEVMFSVSDLSVQLLAETAAAPHPGIPSIILTVSNNIGGIK
jgi:chorismate mutase